MFLKILPSFLVATFMDMLVNEAKRIYMVPLASQKIDQNFGGRLELLTSIYQNAVGKMLHTYLD